MRGKKSLKGLIKFNFKVVINRIKKPSNPTLVLGVLLIFWSHVSAQMPSIPFIDSTITIDGKLDDPVWLQAPEFTGFHNFYPNDEGLAINQTKVKVFHDGEKIYFSAIYFDSTKENVVGSLKRDDHQGAVVTSDAFGIVIDAFNKKNNGYYFTLNSAGTQLDALVNFNGSSYDIDTSWNTIWESKTSINGSEKSFEMAIPFKAINFNIENPIWRFQFFVRDIKSYNWMTYAKLSNNFIQFDLRFTKEMLIEKLPKNNPSKFTITPSMTFEYQENTLEEIENTTVRPSLDMQYNLTSSLRLDATINPDFSQVEVDQQVTNLSRFAIFFPEQRNFFLENSDLFANLGTDDVNPFYSRIIGRDNNIQFGLKLSGNVTSGTRIGILNVQTEKGNSNTSQNFATLVLQQQISKLFSTTVFMVNRQRKDKLRFLNDYNRVTGININYRSNNNKWIGLMNYAKSFTTNYSDRNSFYNTSLRYSTRKLRANIGIQKIGVNYFTDVGFVPRLYNFDAINNETVREGYTKSEASIAMLSLPVKSKTIQSFRYLFPRNTTYWDNNGVIMQSSNQFDQNIWFKNSSSVYWNVQHEYINLQYGFDPLDNGNFITEGKYSYASFGAEYNSPNNNRVTFSAGLQHGGYYEGIRSRYYLISTYRFLPIAKIGLDYEVNYLDLNELGRKTFHLVRFAGELFLNNRLNWTTYVQYNTQIDNFNINSRLQWEYRPLSYIYFVITDNFNKDIHRTNWGVAFKMSYRFDF